MVTLAVAWGAVILVLLAISAFFSSSESAIFSLAPDWIDARRDTTDRRAATLAALRDDPHRLLVTILVGNNVVNVAISAGLTTLAAEYLDPGLAVVAATVVGSTLVLVFGEIVPKSYGLGHAETWSLVVAGPLALVGRAISPLVFVFDWLTGHLTAAIGGGQAIEEPYLE